MTADQLVYVVVRVTPTLAVVTRGKFLMTDGVRVAYRPVDSRGGAAGLVRGANVTDVYGNEADANFDMRVTHGGTT